MSTSKINTIVNPRAARGKRIATTQRLDGERPLWIIPSESSSERYRVDPDAIRCTCRDFEIHRSPCKHLFAVKCRIEEQITRKQKVVEPDGRTTVTVTTATVTREARITYPQNWPAYNAAQTEEMDRFTVLLSELCSGIPQPAQTTGRPRLPLGDMIFAAAFKVYSGRSSRRFASEVRHAYAAGQIASTPHFNSVSNYLADPEITPLLREMVHRSSLPLRSVETDFAVASSGFGTSRFVRWYNKKYGREIDNREWVKVHLMCGVQTHIVTSVEVSGWAAHDTTYFAPLVQTTAESFRIAEVSADKAYLSRSNVRLVEDVGGTPFMPFKSNSIEPHSDSAWTRMYHYFAFNRDTFLYHYHKRSNVETVFSMVKAKFGDSVRSKSDTGMVNEVLCKVLAHNICVVNQAIHELGIEVAFCAEKTPAQELAV